jgi:hypothetical protein
MVKNLGHLVTGNLRLYIFPVKELLVRWFRKLLNIIPIVIVYSANNRNYVKYSCVVLRNLLRMSYNVLSRNFGII